MDEEETVADSENQEIELESVKEEKKETPKQLKLKKTWRTNFISPTGVKMTENFCRRCVQYKHPKEFTVSPDTTLDKSGMMSICKSCCEEIYQNNLRAEGAIDKAVLKTCRILNWIYIQSVVEVAILKKEKVSENFGFMNVYWSVVQSYRGLKGKDSLIPSILTFSEPIVMNFNPRNNVDEDEINDEIIDFWGEGYETSDYKILQKNFLEFKRDYKIDVKTEVFLAKELCYKMLELEKARPIGGTESILKSIQTMMKDAAWTPAMSNMANSGVAKDTFGQWIAEIEKNEPAEWLDTEARKQKILNYGNLQYFKDYFVRSLKNFILQTRDWSIENSVSGDEESGDIEDIIVQEGKDAQESETIREE